MNAAPQRRLAVGTLRAFEAVARGRSFRGAAEELHLTQPAVSRQIRALEEDIGTALFTRGTRKVEITPAGQALLRVVAPWLVQLDDTVQSLRSARRRLPVAVTTFASFATLWLLPRLAAFQRQHPDFDIRISAQDRLADLDDPEIDLGLRLAREVDTPPGSTLLFEEWLTPVASPNLLAREPLRTPADLRRHTLLEEEDGTLASAATWRRWLDAQAGGAAPAKAAATTAVAPARRGARLAAHRTTPKASPGRIEPRGWVYLNYSHQQIQAALAGQGVALARLALVTEALARGDLVEPFGASGRLLLPQKYWLVRWPARRERPALTAFEKWLLDEAHATREAIAAVPTRPAATPATRAR